MLISVIIPVKNGAATLEACLQAVRGQNFAGNIEIIVLDSESTDNSVEIALRYHATIIDVPVTQFNHGLTRNLGAGNASGALLYFTVQDARIADKDMLQKMAAHFSDIAVQAVTGMQAIPHETDKNPALWFKRSGLPEVKKLHFAPNEFVKMSGKEQIGFCRWDNVNSMYRKTALGIQPFAETNLSEDIIWAKEALEKGWTLVWDPSLVVYHYHHQTFNYVFRNHYIIHYSNLEIFGIPPAFPRITLAFLRRANTILKRRELSFFSKLKWIFHNGRSIFASWLSAVVFKIVLLPGGKKLAKKSVKFFSPALPQGKQSDL